VGRYCWGLFSRPENFATSAYRRTLPRFYGLQVLQKTNQWLTENTCSLCMMMPQYISAVLFEMVLNSSCHNRGIGRRGPISWPPSSPYLNPLDFYLWGAFKNLCVFSSFSQHGYTSPAQCERLPEYPKLSCDLWTCWAVRHKICQSMVDTVNTSCKCVRSVL
jgi:hypothetical protein